MHPVQEFLEFCDHVRADDDHDCWSMTWLDTLAKAGLWSCGWRLIPA